jgi:protein-disulfide isomerase
VSELGSAPVPAPADDDHRRGPAGTPLLIEYADFECPFCAVEAARLSRMPVQVVFRHFPVRSSHPRAWAAASAAEAAAAQDRFWEMHDSLFGDQGRLEDPHLWHRAAQLGLDLERFEGQRRSEEVVARVRRDFHSGVRAGVVTTPALFEVGPAGIVRVDTAAVQQRLARDKRWSR